MPGLVGVVQEPTGNIDDVLDTVQAPMRRDDRLASEARTDPAGRWALARIHLGVLQPISQLSGHDAVKVLFHGDLYNEAELRSLVGPAASIEGDGVVPLVRALYRRYGKGFAIKMQGAFSAAVLDESTRTLTLATDLVGSYPLYWSHTPARFVFASELKAVLRDPALKVALNPRALADYLWFGFIFGDKTLAEGVRLVPPASTLTYRWREQHVAVERYRDLSQTFRPWEGSRSEYSEAVRTSFRRAVARALSGNHRFGLSLSGGLDSRTILSAIDGHRGRVCTYTLGIRGCADQVIATRMSKIRGTSHRFFELDRSYLGDFVSNLRRMVSLTDGMYLSHGLTEMLALTNLLQADFSVLLRGHGGELAKASLAWPFHTDARIHGMQSRQEFVPYLLARANYVSARVPFSELFHETWAAAVENGPRLSLDESLGDVALRPPDLCSYLYLKEHHPRFTVPSLELFRNRVEVRLPFMDAEFLDVLLRAPATWRDGTDIHRDIIRSNDPALLSVRNSNTGATGDAGPLREAFFDKLNSLFKRLNIYGFRHYHNFDKWMREMLLASVDAILLQRQTLARGIFRESTLRRLLEETQAGKSDHSYLWQILLIIELWQQEHL